MKKRPHRLFRSLFRRKTLAALFPAVLLAFCIFAAGCAVGPNFSPPPMPEGTRFTEAPSQEEHAAAALEENWWERLGNPQLNGLIEKALAKNPSIAEKAALVRRAEELQRAEAGSFLPAISAGASVAPQQLNTATLGSPPAMPVPGDFTLYSASVRMEYTLDIFGRARRMVEAAGADAANATAKAEAARLESATAVATLAVQEAGLRESLALARNMAAAAQKRLRIAQAAERNGTGSPLETAARRREAAEAAALPPKLERALLAGRHALAAAAGEVPEHADLPEFHLKDFTLPANIPVGLPGVVIRRRPDVKAAESALHKATALAGVATADLYPRLTISGSAGYASASGDTIFTDPSSVWSIGASLLQPIFRGGELRAKKRAAEAGMEAAEAAWRQTVLQAWADTASALTDLAKGTEEYLLRNEAAEAAADYHAAVAARYAAGGVSLITLLEAESRKDEAALAAAGRKSDQLLYCVGLFQALAGAPEKKQ